MKSHTEYLTFNVPGGWTSSTSRPGRAGGRAAAACKRGSCCATPCTSRPRCSSTTTSRACTKTTTVAGEVGPLRSLAADLPPQPHRRGQRRRPQKRQVMGREVVVAVTKGKLDFGPWEQIFYGEFDGRRPKAGAGEGDRRIVNPLPFLPVTAISFLTMNSAARRRSCPVDAFLQWAGREGPPLRIGPGLASGNRAAWRQGRRRALNNLRVGAGLLHVPQFPVGKASGHDRSVSA